MNIPVDLKHKPVVIADDYPSIDGRYSDDTDVKGLSLGLAQWNDRGKVDISAKIWRHSGKRWSRQSEELPLHRVLDLAILFCEAKHYFQDSYRFEKSYDPQEPVISRVGLQGDAMTVRMCTDNPLLDEDVKLFLQALSEDDELLSERLRLLGSLLKKMGFVR